MASQMTESVPTAEAMKRLAELEARDKKRKEYKAVWHKKWKSTLTKEQLDEVRTKERERKRAERETMTDEQREEIKKIDRERKRKEQLTKEQLEARRAYNREYKKKQREEAKAKKAGDPIVDVQTAMKELEKGNAVLADVKPPAPTPPEPKKRVIKTKA
jgi:hypothetical protein